MTQSEDIAALARGGRTNIAGFALRLAARLPFLFIAGRVYGPEIVGRYALAVVVIEFAALLATLGLKRGLAQALSATDRPHAHVVFDALMVALLASCVAFAVLYSFPQVMYPNSGVIGLERFLPVIVLAVAWSDVALAALAYRHNVRASVTARAVIEPLTISIAAWFLSFVSPRDGLILAYVVSMAAALVASLVPLVKSYGLPHGWVPNPAAIFQMARRNVPLAGADAIEWGSRNIDRFILGLLFPPAAVGIYFMAQQVSSIPQKLKTSFDPILSPVITQSLSRGDRGAIARQVRQVGFWILAAVAGIALIGAIPAEGVMGVVGPEFVAGAGALVFLLIGEALAVPGAVAESALVYVARHRNLLLSALLLAFQVALSFALVLLMRHLGWPPAYQAAGPAVALAGSLALGSVVKVRFLGALLEARVSPLRVQIVWAILAASAVGWAVTHLPEWAELLVGIPVILIVYAFVLWMWAFGPEDRTLFQRMPGTGGPAPGRSQSDPARGAAN